MKNIIILTIITSTITAIITLIITGYVPKIIKYIKDYYNKLKKYRNNLITNKNNYNKVILCNKLIIGNECSDTNSKLVIKKNEKKYLDIKYKFFISKYFFNIKNLYFEYNNYRINTGIDNFINNTYFYPNTKYETKYYHYELYQFLIKNTPLQKKFLYENGMCDFEIEKFNFNEFNKRDLN